MKEITELVAMSKYAGERFDLVQAGGGNTSVKLDDGSMLIKASGFLLSDVGNNSGYARVSTQQVAAVPANPAILQQENKREREAMAEKLVNAAMLEQGPRPSIETLLHSLLGKYVLHTHPVLVNIITARQNWQEVLDKLFPDSVKVKYSTPGIDLAIELQKELGLYREKHGSMPCIVFLQNHGLIISSDRYEDIRMYNEKVLERIGEFLNVSLPKYGFTSKVSDLLRQADPGTQMIAYLSEDATLQQADRALFFEKPFAPDIVVFCGMETVTLASLEDEAPIVNYKNKYQTLPRVILFEDHIFCISVNVKKARETEEVLKFSVLTLAHNKVTEMNFLADDELRYLSEWEAEKYRQKI